MNGSNADQLERAYRIDLAKLEGEMISFIINYGESAARDLHDLLTTVYENTGVDVDRLHTED